MDALYWKILLKWMIWGYPPILGNPQIVGLISRMVISSVPGPENRQMPRLENSESRNPQHGALELDLSTCAVETCDTTTADLEIQHISPRMGQKPRLMATFIRKMMMNQWILAVFHGFHGYHINFRTNHEFEDIIVRQLSHTPW